MTGPAFFNGTTDFGLARVRYSGGLEPSFGNNGKTAIDFGSTGSRTDVPIDIDRQQSGRLVIGGTCQVAPVGNNLLLCLAGVLPNGQLDAGFGVNGLVLTDADPNGVNDEIFAIDFDREEEYIYGTGFSNPGQVVGAGPNFNYGTARWLRDGQLDTSFADHGVLITTFGNRTDDRPRALMVDISGAIVLGGQTRKENVSQFDIGLVRYDSAARLDRGFARSASVSYPNQAEFDGGLILNLNATSTLLEFVPLNNGMFLAGGSVGSKMYVLRFLHNGRVHTTFGVNGLATIDFGAGTVNTLNSLATDACGSIYVVGNSRLGALNRFAVAKLTPEGALDTSFYGTGTKTFEFEGVSSGFLRDVLVDSQGRVVVVGEAVAVGSATADFFVFRLSA
jgi:uncharacterized delta-60 repeat protein